MLFWPYFALPDEHGRRVSKGQQKMHNHQLRDLRRAVICWAEFPIKSKRRGIHPDTS